MFVLSYFHLITESIKVYIFSLIIALKIPLNKIMKVSFKTIVCNQNKYRFYYITLNRKLLEKICFVSRRDEDNTKGFQRLLSLPRAKAIAKYMDVEGGVIPSTLILSAQKDAKLEYDPNTSTLSFTDVENSFLVLDGQHRLYGFINSKNNYQIPVIVFNNLTTTQEVGLFIDINTNQKGVPTTLLLDIKNLTGNETPKEEKQRQLFDLINKNSVIAGLMNPRNSSTGKISRNTFNIATNELLENGYFSDEPINLVYQGIKNYLEASDNVLSSTVSSNAKLTKSMIFRSLFKIFPDIIDNTLKKHGNLKVESIEQELSPIALLNYDNYSGSSAALLSKIISEMKMEINKNNNYNFQFNSDIF
jgi:DNA sulfur modification protein DndB